VCAAALPPSDVNPVPLPAEAAAGWAEVAFYSCCRRHHLGEEGTGDTFGPLLRRALRWYGIHDLEPSEPLRGVLWRLAVAHRHETVRHRLCSGLLRVAVALAGAGLDRSRLPISRDVLDRVALVADSKFPFVTDNARQATYELFDRERFLDGQRVLVERIEAIAAGEAADEATWESPHDVLPIALRLMEHEDVGAEGASRLAELVMRRIYDGRIQESSLDWEPESNQGHLTLDDGTRVCVLWNGAAWSDVEADRVERLLPVGTPTSDVEAEVERGAGAVSSTHLTLPTLGSA